MIEETGEDRENDDVVPQAQGIRGIDPHQGESVPDRGHPIARNTGRWTRGPKRWSTIQWTSANTAISTLYTTTERTCREIVPW